MPFALSLDSVAALFRKLERESYRAFHTRSATHKADHFFNFCVTAHAMRDYCLEHLGKVTATDKQPFHELWNKSPTLVATMEIANLSKHFVLRVPKTKSLKTPATQTVRIRKSRFVDIYVDQAGRHRLVRVEHADVSVALSDGTILLMHQFTHEVMEYWRTYLAKHGIRLRRQPLTRLAGSGT